MAKNTYWIADPTDGTKALVEGVDERDRWVKGWGWSEAEEPQGLDFVWITNSNPELGASRLNWIAANDPAWAARGWAPGAPPVPVNNAIPPERRASSAAAETKPVPTKPAAPAEDKK
jgi:hypothetical protein